MPAISVLMKPSSGMCNMRCDYCFYCDETEKRTIANYGFMSEETLQNVIRRTLTRAEHMASFAFQGGEPTLAGLDFFKKVMGFEKKYNFHQVRIQNSLQTNGILIDDEWCHFLKENHFLVGLSVDGLQEIHDKHRKLKNSKESGFECACHAAECMDRIGVDYNILTVVHKDVAQHIEEIYDMYKKRGWHFQQYIACLEPLEEGHGNHPFAITPQEYGDFLIRLFDLWFKDVQKGKAPYIRQFENYAGILLGYSPEACDQRGVCGIQYVVEADGSVFPCDFYMLDEYKLGNFNADRLPVIDAKRKEIGFLERSMQLEDSCSTCPFYQMCRGGCQRNRDLNAETGKYHNYFCESYKRLFEACLPRLKAVTEKSSL